MSENDSRYSFNLGTKTGELTKDEKLDKIFWFKIILSLVSGVAFGILNLTGFISFIM
jgi:hypothetical protein